jgi:nicotinate-nucleotide pyrophosphorylase (carboxylating)
MEIPSSVIDLIHRALEEDIGPGDITTSLLIPDENKSRALYIAKGNFVLAGLPFSKKVFQILDPSMSFNIFYNEGAKVIKGDVVAEVLGKTRTILAGERVSLNILQRLSGIATLTSMYVDNIKGLKAKIVDTRKTTPCQRFLEKYAVRMGGGSNHRFGLFDGILIKDNHIEAVGSIKEAVKLAKGGHHLARIEVEVENIHCLKEAFQKDPSDYVVRKTLEKSYEAQGDIGGFITLLEETLLQHPDQKSLLGTIRRIRTMLKASSPCSS